MSEVVDQKTWLKQYFDLYKGSIFNNQILDDLINVKILWENAQANGKKVIFAGNGGSAAMASHCSVDLTKNAGLRAVNFNEADLITCFSNDYGYERWIEKAVDFYADKNDTLVLISSSGKSKNMINACKAARRKKIKVISLTGHIKNNPLSKIADLSLWIDSKAYNFVENTHQIWLLTICDLIIGKREYPAKKKR